MRSRRDVIKIGSTGVAGLVATHSLTAADPDAASPAVKICRQWIADKNAAAS